MYRVDHYLGMSTVLNIVGLRFANRMLESVLNGEHLHSIDIVFDETLALEGRAGYYDGAGALVDMIQSHSLQELALLAMEAPSTLQARDVRDAKAAVFSDIEDVSVIGITEEVIARSVELLEHFPLRSADALHIACAAEWSAELFVSADERQARAARAHGLRVEVLEE